MDHDVRSEFDGPEQERGREGVVHHERNLVPMGDRRHLLDVDDVAVGVAEGLDEQELRLRADGLLEVIQVGRVHEGGRDAVGDERVLQEVVGTSVDGLGRYDMVSRTGDVQDGVGDRRGAGSDGERAHAPFQGGDAALEDVLRRIGQTAVDIARVCQSETGRRVRGVMEDVRGSLINGDSACVGCGIGLFLAHVELQGFEVEFLGAHICSFYLFSVCKVRLRRFIKQESWKIKRNPLNLQKQTDDNCFRDGIMPSPQKNPRPWKRINWTRPTSSS